MDDTKKLIEKYKRELMELSAVSRTNRSAAPKPAVSAQAADSPPSETKTAAKAPKIIGYVEEGNTAYDKFLSDLEKADCETKTAPAQPLVKDLSEDPLEVMAVSEPDDNEPIDDIVNEPEITGSGDNMTEIIDESSGEPLFTPPLYTRIDSTEQVREDITENSDPSENVIEKNVSGITDNSATAPRADVADTIRTTEEQAERLGDQPVSGTEFGEQLTGRSFESPSEPPVRDVSMEQGSRAEPINYPAEKFTDYKDFEQRNTGSGSLMFRVYTGREAVPIQGAECVISKTINGEVHKIVTFITNADGQTPSQDLPAPPKELSQQSENTIQPFALYDATVVKPGFARVVLKDIPVFDGVQSVQRIFMIVDA